MRAANDEAGEQQSPLNWSRLGFNPSGGRLNPFERTLDQSNVANLGSALSAPTGTAGFSAPAVANGVVFVGSTERRVWAVDPATGEKLWSYLTGDWVQAPQQR